MFYSNSKFNTSLSDTANRELRSNLRTAFNYGIGMIRQVSISLPKFLKTDF